MSTQDSSNEVIDLTTSITDTTDITPVDGNLPVILLLSVSSVFARIRQWQMNPFVPRGICPRRQRFEFWNMTASLSEFEFNNTFRMGRMIFKNLCAILRPILSQRFSSDEDIPRERYVHILGRDIQTEVKVALFLRVMAGASVLDVHLLFRIGRSSAFRIFRKVVMAVLKELPWESFPLHAQDGGFKDMALSFALSRTEMNPLPGFIAALDGLQVQIARPGREFNPMQYFSRKGCFTLPVQAIVDSGYRFISCSVLAVGSTHDNVAFSLSSIHRYLHSPAVANGFWVAADEAYTCTESVLVPFTKSLCTPVHDGYNYYLSSHRIHVEQAFGMLKRRWSILFKPLGFNIQLSTKVIPAAMKLHNFVMNMGIGITKPPRTHTEIRAAEERLEFWLRWCQTGEDVDENLRYELEPLSGSAERAERRSENRRKLVTICRREHLRRPSPSEDS